MYYSDRRTDSISDVAIRFVILALAALILMTLHQTGRIAPLQNFVTQLTSPAQLSTTTLSEGISETVGFALEFRSLRQRNAELEQLFADLQVENLRLLEIEHENEQLRTILDFAETRPGLSLRGAQIVARVIGQESNNFLDYIMLDLGTEHGVAVGMPVVVAQGMVGRISEVTETTSKVLLITDTNSAMNVILQKSRLNGILRGNPDGTLNVNYIPQGAVFEIGETVLSSGLGGRFPKGIPMGKVTEIFQRDIDVFQSALVEPTVDFRRLELAMVVTSFDPLENVPELIVPQEVAPQDGVPQEDDVEEEEIPTDESEQDNAAPADEVP